MTGPKVQINVRMPERLRAAIAKAAAKSGESMNADIVDRLERSFRDDEVMADLRAVRDMLARYLANSGGSGR